ncbi:hypothetical protein CPB84DRAFT_1783525 [Gymnopilus junonius]|uniref:Uncharacterized protein n=1 Tax=Gymnopilus junonius TaxID=109634 RepID=A0A9P5NM72_GYMJU|nr:hypothetical protein CPB84DRAFT_1783525 [Gymnopilus junonius]
MSQQLHPTKEFLSNPNVLSCITSGILCGIPLGARAKRSELYDDVLFARYLMKHLGCYDSEVKITPPEILDAFAGVSASKAYNPRVACGMKISKNVVEVLLAGGDTDIADQTVAQIRFIWSSMRQISTAGSENRRQRKDLERMMKRRIYSFILPRLCDDFAEYTMWIRDWITWHEIWRTTLNRGYPRDADEERMDVLFEEIVDLAAKFDRYKGVLEDFRCRGSSGDDETFNNLIHSLAKATDQVHDIIGNEDICRLEPYPLIHGLENLTRLPDHVVAMRALADHKLVVTTLSPVHGDADLQWPTTPSPGKGQLKRSRFPRHRFLTKEELTPIGNHRRQHDFSRLPDSPTKLFVHPELRVAMFDKTMGSRGFSGYSDGELAPLEYVGTSDYCCAACEWWISEYNSRHPYDNVFIKGSSNIWEVNWCIPPFEMDYLGGYIASSLRKFMVIHGDVIKKPDDGNLYGESLES